MEDIAVQWMPKALAMRELIERLCLSRSYEAWLGNNRKDVVSAYMGGNIIVVTFGLPPAGEPTQLVLLREEIPDLPPILRTKLEGDLKQHGVEGLVIVSPRKED
jgi:hypothetical protein